MIGVDRKTVGRWISGKVKRIARYNAEALAQYLECNIADITITDEADIYATREEQRVAAELLHDKNIIRLIRPTEDWALAESLIKATMQPNLPINQLGLLYSLLASAVWGQGDFTKALDYAERALDLGERSGDKAVIAKTMLSRATLLWFTGKTKDYLKEIERCEQWKDYLKDKSDLTKLLLNLAVVDQCHCRFDKSEKRKFEALRIANQTGDSFYIRIAHKALTSLYTELGRLSDAKRSINEASKYAKDAKFRWKYTILFYKADIACLQGDFETAENNISEGWEGLSNFDIYDLFCYEATVRFYRRTRRFEKAIEAAENALVKSEKYSYIHALTLQERARLALAIKDNSEEEEYRNKANRIFEDIGLYNRVRTEPVAEFGEMFK